MIMQIGIWIVIFLNEFMHMVVYGDLVFFPQLRVKDHSSLIECKSIHTVKSLTQRQPAEN